MKKEVLTEVEAEKFLKGYVPIAKNQLVQKKEQIKIKAPLVLKIMSKDLVHKSDSGGVKIIHSQQEVEREFEELVNKAKKKKWKLQGILVQEYHDGYSVIIGIKKDLVFGHVILLGAGGIFTEVMKDISIRACPITEEDADAMIKELRYREVLEGKRGKKANLPLLKKILVKISRLPQHMKNVEELDINPLIINDKEACVVDVRMVIMK